MGDQVIKGRTNPLGFQRGVLAVALVLCQMILAGPGLAQTLRKIDTRMMSFGPRIDLEFGATERLATVVENNRAWIQVEPCEFDAALAKEQDLGESGVRLRMEESPPAGSQKCRAVFESKKPLFGLRASKKPTGVTVDLFFDSASLTLYDQETALRKLVAVGAEQEPLREIAVQITGQSAHPYAQDVVRRSLREGSYPLVVAMAYGVCRNQRFEFQQELLDLHLPSLFSGTPDAAWLRCCLERFRILAGLKENTAESRGEIPLDILGIPSGSAGEIVSQALWKRLATLERSSDEARRINVILALADAQHANWAGEVSALERALAGTTDFSFELALPGEMSCESSNRSMLRLNRVNLSFLKGQILRDRLKQYAAAQEVFTKLTQLPRDENYVSVHATENASVKPAAVEARAELAQTLFLFGNHRKACALWAELAWQEAETPMVGLDEEMTYCGYALGQMEKKCGLLTRTILQGRSGHFRKTPQHCRERMQGLVAGRS